MKLVQLVLAGALASASLAAAAQQVKYFDRPPTVEEMQDALVIGANDGGSKSKGVRTRGIAWSGAAANTAAAPTSVAAVDATSGVTSGAAIAAGVRPGSEAPAIAVPVNFNASSSQVQPASLAYVEVVSQLLVRNPGMRLAIEGHTDASGNARRNMMLSWERAFAVFRVLVERYGVDPARLQPIGKGSTELLPNAQPADPQNRRVQFRVAG